MSIEENKYLKIGPRYIKENNGFRVFQAETIESLTNSDSNLICVEAPVGSGKSYIVKKLIEDNLLVNKTLILTFPTKILLDSQINSLVSNNENYSIWPETQPEEKKINLFKYTSDSLVSFLQKQPDAYELDKSQLLNKVITSSLANSKKFVIVTTPDVLHLLVNRKIYNNSKRIQSYLNNAVIFFDEFHLYANYTNFPKLIDNLLTGIASKIVLLSATPFMRDDLKEIMKTYNAKTINFQDSIGTKDDFIFNHELEIEIHSYQYRNIKESSKKLIKLLPDVKKPAAIIFDSVFRLKHIKKQLQQNLKNIELIEWSGLQKDKFSKLNENTVIIGTASIEVGINYNFKTLLTEATDWTSAIQRIGRTGRFDKGKVIILTNKNFNIVDRYIANDKNSLDRTVFENEVLKEVLRDPKAMIVSGESFRGDSYNFLLFDPYLKNEIYYSEAIFSMYDIENHIDEWQLFDIEEKKEALKELEPFLKNEKRKEILLKDKVLPFWGILKGTLNDKYKKVSTRYDKEDNELTILIEDSPKYIFYKGQKEWI